MPFHLDVLKRHSDPAPCTSKSTAVSAQKTARSNPDLRSPMKSPVAPRTTPNSSPSRNTPRRSNALKYRRLSSAGYGTPNVGYFNTTPRRATHPNASPRRLRRWSLWLEEEEDPWTQFRLKSLGTAVPNGDDKPFMTAAAAATADSSTHYRLRSFSVTSKGIVNHGDFLRSRSHSDASVSSEDFEQCFAARRDSAASTSSSTATAASTSKYKVLLLGSESVGKTSLVAQFSVSDFLTTLTDPQLTTDNGEERTVSLMVDGEESELVCEHTSDPANELDESVYCSTHAFLVVYSLSDKKSFFQAIRILDQLRDLKNRCAYPGVTYKTIILVANKVDLVRCRTITAEEGRVLADEYDVKYVETSAGFNHHVDELLVGIVTQIRLHISQQQQSAAAAAADRSNFVARSMRFTVKARGLMNRLLQKCELKTRSCVNLHIL